MQKFKECYSEGSAGCGGGGGGDSLYKCIGGVVGVIMRMVWYSQQWCNNVDSDGCLREALPLL